MQNFIEIYRDPLFGIIVLVAIVGIVALADYSKARNKRKKQKQSLENLNKSFENGREIVDGLSNFLQYAKNPFDTLMPIAKLYTQAGNYDQAINIYINLMDKLNNANDKILVLEALGVNYYKAGFLYRAKKIFQEVLKNYPNNPQILKYLMISCEDMGLYEEAIDALNCIEEIQNIDYDKDLDCNIDINKSYLEVMNIITNYQYSIVTQTQKLLQIYQRDESVHSLVLRHFRNFNLNAFWEQIVQKNDVSNYIDILWSFESNLVPYSMIKDNRSLMQIFCAKGYIDNSSPLNNFSLEIIRVLNKHSKLKGKLKFSYRCMSCSGVLPFYSHRCPICSFVGENKLVIETIQG